MLTITEYTVEQIKDPFGILQGARYEFILNIDVEEDDELFTENGLYIRAIYAVQEQKTGLIKYEIYERGVDKYLDFELEDEEIAEVETFCKEHLE